MILLAEGKRVLKTTCRIWLFITKKYSIDRPRINQFPHSGSFAFRQSFAAMMITSFLMEKDIFRLIEFYLEKATLSASLILAECRTRVTYEFLNGPYSPKSLCVSGSEIRAWSCLFFVSGRFSCLPAGIYLSYIFPSLSKTLYKVKILQIFLCCINLFEARHVIKMLGHILKKLSAI